MNEKLAALTLTLLTASTSAFAQTATVDCTFPKYANDIKSGSQDFEIKFVVNTDDETGKVKAFSVGNVGSNEVYLLSSHNSMTFIENTESGSVQTTTMLFESGKAVHSRNTVATDLSGKNPRLIPSQSYGSCEVK
ncbi:hypothetical protein [Vibrio mediterranei]|jgi:hypothetical protein|uniref:hypothetical protein n=1 Tax=Vibrio mediterranei TaxID=689 RepID=UPI0022844B94|nr:hypothetical protein [Vibrio mediterranei]MCY9855304.1 hypothetical protein [Vibrio mediterranei]